MSAFEWFTVALRNYAVFEGRSRRREFWMFQLVSYLIQIGLYATAGIGLWAMANGLEGLGYILFFLPIMAAGLFSLATLLPSLAVSVRRLHDTGRSGALLLLGFIPFVGWIVIWFFMASEGDRGDNFYGSDPKDSLADPRAPRLAMGPGQPKERGAVGAKFDALLTDAKTRDYKQDAATVKQVVQSRDLEGSLQRVVGLARGSAERSPKVAVWIPIAAFFGLLLAGLGMARGFGKGQPGSLGIGALILAVAILLLPGRTSEIIPIAKTRQWSDAWVNHKAPIVGTGAAILSVLFVFRGFGLGSLWMAAGVAALGLLLAWSEGHRLSFSKVTPEMGPGSGFGDIANAESSPLAPRDQHPCGAQDSDEET